MAEINKARHDLHGSSEARDASKAATLDWHTANQGYLRAALDLAFAYLSHPVGTKVEKDIAQAQHELKLAEGMLPAPSALDRLCVDFGLSPFERNVLLMCAGLELDASFGPLFATVHGDPQHPYPSFSLALSVLPDSHWSALAPEAALRRWRLIEIGSESTLVSSHLRIDERILHYLLGINYMDDRLRGFVEKIHDTAPVVPSQERQADHIVRFWSRQEAEMPSPVVQLCGAEASDRRSLAMAVSNKLGWSLYAMGANSVPVEPRELQVSIRLWEREATLSRAVLLIDCDGLDTADSAHAQAVARFVENTAGLIILSSRERRPLGLRRAISIDVCRPTIQEQKTLWQQTLGVMATSLNGHIEMLAAQFNLNASGIRSVGAEVTGNVSSDGMEEQGSLLWNACRRQSRPRMDELAQRVVSQAGWDDLVLPEAQIQTLHDLAGQVRQRSKVYEQWGFAAKSSRGLGISALFTGASGTGKTLAAEVLANELMLDLYRIDLSQVVSKYIGETEKNLRRVFDAAEEGGAVLLFDEADALFGKRSEVKDSHDRYANIEVSYLLQRMEAYRGLAILTTNMKDALDTAFLRRIRFIINFPFPDAVQRSEIWRRIFPTTTPTEGVDMARLARLNVAGGNIRNIAINAAFLAADAGEPVRMSHLLRAARIEYAKLERPLTASETGDWG